MISISAWNEIKTVPISKIKIKKKILTLCRIYHLKFSVVE